MGKLGRLTRQQHVLPRGLNGTKMPLGLFIALTLTMNSGAVFSGTTDPVPSAEETAAEDTTPIVIDLDIPPELADFLAAQEAAETGAEAEDNAEPGPLPLPTTQDEPQQEDMDAVVASPVVDAPSQAEATTESVAQAEDVQEPSAISSTTQVESEPALTQTEETQTEEPTLAPTMQSAQNAESMPEILPPRESSMPMDDQPPLAPQDAPAANPLEQLPFAACFAEAASAHDIEESLLIGIAIVESSMDPSAVSSSEAIGLMQIKWPITANHLGIDERDALFDPCTNVDAGARYLRELLDDLSGFAAEPRMRLALASYRLGPNGFDPNVPLPAIAQDYIEKVNAQQLSFAMPTSNDQIATTAGPVLPCLVQNLRQLAVITHDPGQRSAQVGAWLQARGDGCSTLALIQIRNNLPVWLGTALTPERVTQVQGLLENSINITGKDESRPTRRQP